jgi:hypothetical protein
MFTAFILLAAMDAAPTPATTQTPAPTPVKAMTNGQTRTLADVARERKLGAAPRAGGFSATGSTAAPQVAGQTADTSGCSRSAEAKLNELNSRNLSSEAYSRQKQWIHEEEVACSVIAADKQAVAAAEQDLQQAFRDLLSSPTKVTAAQVLKASAPAKRNVTTTVGRDGTVHTSEQWVYPGIGYLYFRDGILETVQTR